MKLIALPILSVALSALLSTSALAQFRLENDRWRIDIDPETLALEVTVSGEESVRLSSGVGQHRVDRLENDAASAAWRWDDGAYSVSVRLDGEDLKMSLGAARAGTLDIVNQLAGAMGKGLILPQAEGYYVPAGNQVWLDFITERFSPVNTSQELSLPLLGMDHGAYTLNWIWENPFNNQIDFVKDGDGLSVRFAHEFTSLDPSKPLQLTLHLGSGDLLSGAKRYRKMLIDGNRYERLADKLSAVGSAGKLLGAPQIYLWGNDLLGTKDVKDWPGFVKRLNGPSPLAKALRAEFYPEVQKMLEAMLQAKQLTVYKKRVILADVNLKLTELARKEWQGDKPDWEAMTTTYARLKSEVAATFGNTLSSNVAGWGQTLSKQTFTMLKKAGVTKAWIGLGDGWEGGLWNPAAVQAGIDAGFLIAPYGSYQTGPADGPAPRLDHGGARQGGL